MSYMDDAFNNYFRKAGAVPEQKESINIITQEKRKPVPNFRDGIKDFCFNRISFQRVKADENMDTIDQICSVIKKLLNAAWGNGWGEFSPDLKRGEKSSEIILPQITAEINERDISDGMPKKPVLMDTVKDENTDESFLIYRQWFDCNIEFDFYGRTGREVRELQNKFETILQIYSGYLKRHGISEIIFLREFSARNSLNFMEQVPMKCLVFYMRLEKIFPVRMSLISKINADIGIKGPDSERIQTAVEHNRQAIAAPETRSDELDFDISFGEGVEYDGI